MFGGPADIPEYSPPAWLVDHLEHALFFGNHHVHGEQLVAFAVVAFSVIVQGLTAPLALKALRLVPVRRVQAVIRDARGRPIEPP